MKKKMLVLVAIMATSIWCFADTGEAASAIIESSRKLRLSKFVFKGFYTSMSDADALILLRHYDSANSMSYKLTGNGIEFDDALLGKRLVVKSEGGKVSEFRFSRSLCDIMFRSSGVPTADFCQAVVNAYEPIKELQRIDIDIPDWAAYLKEYVPPIVVGKVPRKMIRGYYFRDGKFEFELRIAPSNDPIAYQTDFFVVRRIWNLDIRAFD